MSDQPPRLRILVIGEQCLDRTVTCRIDRLCPEAPVPVLNPVLTTSSHGMAGNVYANLISLGAISGDVDCLFPPTVIEKTRYVDQQTGYIVVRVDEHDSVKRIDRDRLVSALSAHLGIVVISDYCKGFLHEDDIEYIGNHCRERGITTFLDTKKRLGGWSIWMDYVKINQREFDAHVNCDVSAFCRNLIVTQGDRGCWWVNRDTYVPVDPVRVADVCGAGDSHLAAFALEFMRNRGRTVEALSYANRAARIAASRRGIVAVLDSETRGDFPHTILS